MGGDDEKLRMVDNRDNKYLNDVSKWHYVTVEGGIVMLLD